MNQTTRRTARITIPYTAISLQHIESDMIHCQARKDLHIEGVNGGSVDIKAGQWFYCVRAEDLNVKMGRDDLFYIVKVGICGKKCSCPARKPCKHEIAVAARDAASLQAQERSTMPKAKTARTAAPAQEIATMKQAATPLPRQRTSDLGQRGHLNSNRGFTLLK